MGNMLTREALLSKEKLEIVKIEFDNGDYVFVKQMTGRERDQFERSVLKETKDKKGRKSYETVLDDFRSKLAVLTLCNEKGETLLQPNDYATLANNMSAKTLEKIINEAQRINGISEEDKEEIIKNSVADQVGDSSSNSVEK